MGDFLSILMLPPIFRGFIGMLLSGACFPLCGVFVVKLKMIPLRYMLMHGVILGGAIALAMELPSIPIIIITNIVLVFLMVIVSKNQNFDFSGGSAAIMVLTMALASLITHIKDVPAKDSLNLLWGSPFALSTVHIFILATIFIGLLAFIILSFNKNLVLFHNLEIAKSMGFKIFGNYVIIVMIVAIVVALGMKLLGAFLIDALLILPVLCYSSITQSFVKKISIKKLFIFSSLIGICVSFMGYIIAVAVDCPPSGVIALISGLLFIISAVLGKIKKRVFFCIKK